MQSFFVESSGSPSSSPSFFLLPNVDQLTLSLSPSKLASIDASVSALNVLLSSSPFEEPNFILEARLKVFMVDFAKFFRSTFISSAMMLENEGRGAKNVERSDKLV